MFPALWHYLRGYVMIRAKGFAAERFMNLAAYRGAALWDVAAEGSGMRMKAHAGDLPILEACAEKTGCTLEILAWGGLPCLWRRFRGRQVWLVGMFCFALGLYLLSSFIWVIEVEGNERLAEAEILDACREMGLRPGAWKRGIEPEEITEGLLSQFADISWVSVGIQGTDLTIKLAETIEKADMIDKTTPCDIVAGADGLILQITAERGTPLVSAGDMVQKGDVLISSEILIGLEGEPQRTEYAAAEGAVTARIWQRLAEDAPFQYEEKQTIGAAKENHSILLGEWELDIFTPDCGAAWESTLLWEKPLAIGDWQLPLRLRKESRQGFIMVEKTRTSEEAKAFLEENLRKKIENSLSPYGTIEENKLRFTEYADGIHAEAEITLTERIEKKQEREWEGANGSIREDIADGE